VEVYQGDKPLMKIFADLHHGDLFYSLHRLFVERLGWELYRPIGHDWFREGYWKIAEPYGNAQDTINQYLDINSFGYDAYANLNGQHYFQDDVYHTYDPGHDYYQKGITLEKFKSMKFDIVLSSFSAHDAPYGQLRDLFQPQSKLVAHLGNGGQKTKIKNVITSTPYTPLLNQTTVYVHQELDPKLYHYVPPSPDTRNIYSMVNCLPRKELYYQYKDLLPDVNFKAYGSGSPDGALSGSKGVGAKMPEANLGWQIKPLGGLGHTAMGWFASGRPVITNMSQNRITGGDAMLLFEPGVTCIDIEQFSVEEGCREIRRWLEPENNLKYSENARARFHSIINYDEEEVMVRKFLEKVL